MEARLARRWSDGQYYCALSFSSPNNLDDFLSDHILIWISYLCDPISTPSPPKFNSKVADSSRVFLKDLQSRDISAGDIDTKVEDVQQ